MAWFGRMIANILSIIKWSLVATALLSGAYIVYQFVNVGSTVLKPVWVVTDLIGLTQSKPEKPKKPLPERVADDKDKYRAYTMLANFEGSTLRRESDKVKVLCTILNLEKTGVSLPDIFALQMELVVPGWGRRKTEYRAWGLGRNIYVPQRRFLWIEKEFPEDQRDAAVLLARDVKDKKMCPSDWKAITIIRPDRPKTWGNQKLDELAAIRDPSGKLTKQEVDPKERSDFEFYRLK